MNTTYRDQETLRRQMILSLGLVDLTEDDRRFLEWLSGWGPETADRFIELIRKVTRPCVEAGRPAPPAPVCTCHPHHIEIGGYDRGCPMHDREASPPA